MIHGPFQSSNFFDNVPAGIQVYVNDKMDVVLSANVLRYLSAKFFTQMATDIMTIGT
jgi:hypothetical protein